MAGVVPLGQPPEGLVIVPSLKSSESGFVVVGLSGTDVVANALDKQKHKKNAQNTALHEAFSLFITPVLPSFSFWS